MDPTALKFEDNTFTHVLGNLLLIVLPDDGVSAAKETYRTLKPGGKAIFNCWEYVPNMEPLPEAAKATRPEGSPLPREGMDKWSERGFIKNVLERGGFASESITVHQQRVFVTPSDLDRYANMLWSFIGGTTAVGWLESDEACWNEAIGIIKEATKRTDGFQDFGDGKFMLKFVANIAIATK